MVKNFVRLIVVSCVIVGLLATQQPLSAQDSGSPVMQDLALYTVIGMAVGAGVGVAVWMLDPLAPSSNMVLSVSNGFGVGAIIGTFFGVMQLQRQAIIPYQPPTIQYDDFESDVRRMTPMNDPEFDYAAALRQKRPAGTPLLSFGFRF